MSPIPKKLFSLSGILRLARLASPAQVFVEARNQRRVTGSWRIVLPFGLALISLAPAANLLCQNPNSEGPASGLKFDLRGKSVFEGKCATCHGLDGLGGEHAPDVIRRPDVKAMSEAAWLKLIHDGIPEAGMPGFPDLGGDDTHAVVAYLRLLQGRSAGNSVAGNPARGQDLFFGKAGCTACHQMGGPGQFVTGDLGGFARDHPGDEIRDAILRPAQEPQEVVTVVARDGRKFSGILRNQDNASLQLQDGDGRFYLLMKSSLTSVQRKIGNPMPLDYGQRLSATELDDLVAYILREAPPLDPTSSPSAGNHAQP
jgi:cytochrome c oxidase cbb3-type subunit III